MSVNKEIIKGATLLFNQQLYGVDHYKNKGFACPIIPIKVYDRKAEEQTDQNTYSI